MSIQNQKVYVERQ